MKRYIAVKYAVTGTYMFQLIKRREEFALYSSRIMTVFSQFPVKVSSVEITGIGSFFRIIFVSIIIYLTDLVTTVNYRDTGLGKHKCMQGNVITDRFVYTLLISFKSKTFNTAERSSSSTESCITKTWIIVIKFSSCK